MFVSLAFIGCETETVVAPSANFDIQILDKIKNEYVNLSTPYELKLNQDYRVISENSTEYNSFYMGDSIFSNKVWLYSTYSELPKSNHRGLVMAYNLDLKKSTTTIKYTVVGVYNVAFVASAAGNNGDIVETAVKTSQVTVVP